MKINRVKEALEYRFYEYVNRRKGYNTNRKIVVIESDDWGSIRMPSKEIYNFCLKSGYPVDKNPYERYDSLASEDDLSLLFEVLKKRSDVNGTPPVITANSMVCNPDFQKIEDNNFETYHGESIEETFRSYPKHSNCLNLWHQGQSEKIFQLQYHGREHLDVHHFMSSLKKSDKDAKFGFYNRMPGSISKNGIGGNKYVLATMYKTEKEMLEKLDFLLEGLSKFENLHNKNSISFIAPNYYWNPRYNKSLSEAGVQFLQGSTAQKVPLFNGKERKIYHFLGEKNEYGQIYLVRNCVFEPVSKANNDPVDICLAQISKSFSLNKPAIISSHRVNYVGFIEEKNRDKNLKLLDKLLNKIILKWPDVEFLSSDQLGTIVDQ